MTSSESRASAERGEWTTGTDPEADSKPTDRRRIGAGIGFRSRVKKAAARTLVGSGALGIVQQLRPPGLTLLMYHRVLPLPEARACPFQGMVLARDEFEGQIAHLARRYRILELSEAVARLAEGSLPRRAVAITFDDGYRDNYEHAVPILRRYGVPATFFVVTDVLDGRLRLWWDVVAEALSNASRASDSRALEGALPWVRAAFVSARQAPREGAAALVGQLNRAARSEREAALAAIRAACPDRPEGRNRIMLSWDEAREMAGLGMQFGTHTKTHTFLDEMSEEEAHEELAGSIARIHEVLGQNARYLAYPRGRVSRERYSALRRAGIEAALTTRMGTNRPGGDLYALLRMDPGFARFDSGFDSAVFDAELAGAFGVNGRT